MQAVPLEQVLDGREAQLGEEAAGVLLGRVREAAGGDPEIRRSAASSSSAQKRTERGNSSWSSRNATTRSGSTFAPWTDLYASQALHERSTAVHSPACFSVRPRGRPRAGKAACSTSRMRVVWSARSMKRPTSMNCQPSPCITVACPSPVSSSEALFTSPKNSAGLAAKRCRASSERRNR